VKNQTPKYDQVSKERARYARNLADLLWRKACLTLSPETQELLIEMQSLNEMAATVDPESQEQVRYDFERIARMVDEAELLLIGKAPESATGPQWEQFQVLVKESQDESVPAL